MINFLIKTGETFSVQSVVGFTPQDAVAVVPPSFDKEDYPFLYGELTVNEFGVETWEVLLDEVAKGEHLAQVALGQEKSALHASYIADIDAEMQSIFGTIDRDKASAMYNTWNEWKADPAFFADKGLYDEFGQALDTGAKIATYANQKLSQTKQYSVFLMTREKQFRDALALLGG